VLTSSNQQVQSLTQQSAFQEATVTALVGDQFGGPVTVDASQALLGGAQTKITEAQSVLFPPCPVNFECAPALAAPADTTATSTPAQRARNDALIALQHADANLALGLAAQADGHFDAAARDAQRAYSDASLAEHLLSVGTGH
jgi:hypothetical protein